MRSRTATLLHLLVVPAFVACAGSSETDGDGAGGTSVLGNAGGSAGTTAGSVGNGGKGGSGGKAIGGSGSTSVGGGGGGGIGGPGGGTAGSAGAKAGTGGVGGQGGQGGNAGTSAKGGSGGTAGTTGGTAGTTGGGGNAGSGGASAGTGGSAGVSGSAGTSGSGTSGSSGTGGSGGMSGCPSGTPVASAAMGSHFDPAVFDATYYLCANPDLLAAGIGDEARARLHWLQNGMAEGRRAAAGFSVTEYLAQYPDLVTAFGTDYGAAVIHYTHHGIKEGRKGTLAGLPNPGAAVGDALRPQGAISYDMAAGVAANAIIDLRSSTRMAGGIDHLGWNGVEFINAWDHGRELQVAWSADGFGECYNPTECGSAQDGAGATSSTIPHLFWTSGDTLASEVQPAFWNAPGIVGSCGMVTHNTTVAASHVLNKHVQVGFGGIQHVVQFLVQLTIPEDLTSLTVEGPTGYLTGAFTSYYTLDFATASLTPLSAGPGEQGAPVILSTPDGSAAMGAWSPDLPQAAFPGAGYGRFAFPDPGTPANATNKWNVVFRRGATPSGVYDFRSFAIVGSLENVRVAMTQLRAMFP